MKQEQCLHLLPQEQLIPRNGVNTIPFYIILLNVWTSQSSW